MPRPAVRLPSVRARVLAAAFAGALALAACGDEPTAPGAEPALASDVTVDGSVGAGREARWRYDAAPDEAIEIRFTPLGYGLALYRVRDDGTLAVLVPATVQADTTTRRVRLVASRRGETLRFAVAPRSGAGGGAFRLTLAGQNRAPESRAAAIALDAMVEERMDGPRDADVYTLTLDAPASVLVMAQMMDAAVVSVPVSARLRPLPDTASSEWSGSVLVTTAVTPGRTLATSATSVATLAPGRYQLVVERDPYLEPAPADARYRVQVRRVNVGPEEGAGVLALGDTVASSIDYVGDVDDWTVRGPPGDSIVAFVQATGAAPQVVRVRPASAANAPASAQDAVASAGQPLVGTSTGRLAIPASGALVLRVEGTDGTTRSSGGYRLFAYRPDTMPEVPQARPATLGETITGSIELPGDVDTYAVTVAAPTLANLVLERAAGAAGEALAAQLAIAIDPPGVIHVRAGLDTILAGSGRVRLDAGTHRLRVAGTSTRDAGFMGGYRLTLVALDSMPESAPRSIAIGDTVRGEVVAPIGDVDDFVFVGGAGDTLTMMIAATTDRAPLPLVAAIIDSLGRPVGTVRTTMAAERPGVETGLVGLPRAGTYHVRVGGATAGRSMTESAPVSYRLFLERLSARPETAPMTVAAGATVQERLDAPGDIDDFFVVAPVGSLVRIAFTGFAGSAGGQLEVWDTPITGHRASIYAPAASPASIVVRVLATGRVRVRASQPGCSVTCPMASLTGAYAIVTERVDVTPEGHPGILAYGDTVRGTLDRPGDIDEYTLDVAAGDVFDVLANRLSKPCQVAMQMRVLDMTTGQGEWGVVWVAATGSPVGSAYVPGSFANHRFTATRTQRLVISWDSAPTDPCGPGDYVFTVQRR